MPIEPPTCLDANLARRERDQDDRERRRVHQRGAEALHDAGADQELRRRRDRARERRRGGHSQAADEDEGPAQDVGQLAADEHERREREGVAGAEDETLSAAPACGRAAASSQRTISSASLRRATAFDQIRNLMPVDITLGRESGFDVARRLVERQRERPPGRRPDLDAWRGRRGSDGGQRCDRLPANVAAVGECAAPDPRRTLARGARVTRLFVLARHGESTLNVERVVNGDPAVDVRLTEKGRSESRLLGDQVRNVPLELCAITRFGRTRETAEIALRTRSVPFEVEPLFDDVDVGELEGASIDEYRAWKRAHTRADPFPNGESLDASAVRYGRALESLLDRPERTILVVAHEIPVRYALNAAEGSRDPDSPHHEIANATPYLFGERELAAAAARLASSNGPRGT